MSIDTYIDEITAATRNRPDYLLQNLYEIQYQYSYVSDQAIKLLAEKLALSESFIVGVIGFYSFLHTTPRGRFDILISDSITDHMLGSRGLLDTLCNKLGVALGQPRADGRVTVDTTSCTGMCEQGPAMLVNGWTITRLDQGRIEPIVELIEADTAVEEWPQEFFTVEDNIQRRDILLSDNSNAGDASESTDRARR